MTLAPHEMMVPTPIQEAEEEYYGDQELEALPEDFMRCNECQSDLA